MRLIALLRNRLRAEEGFTMVVAIGAMVLVLVLSVAAFTAVQGDLGLTSVDSLQKQAYSAAQAGIQAYLYDLDSNSGYWAQCVPTPANGINQMGSTTNTAAVPGSSTERYAIELMPANGYTSCQSTNPVNTMITTTGTGAGALRIRVTGYATGYNGARQATDSRTVIATLREQSFLDYVWFTVYETSDPTVQVANAFNSGGDVTIEPPYQCALQGAAAPAGCGSNYNAAVTGATKQCGQYRYPPPGGTSTTNAVGYNRLTTAYAVPGVNGAFYKTTATGTTYQCSTISFITPDSINGPFHTNDQANICGSPTFGRNSADDIIFGYSTSTSSPYPGGYIQQCTGTPTIKGTVKAPGVLNPPPSNAALKGLAVSPYSLTGTTCVQLTSAGIQIAQPGVGSNAAVQSCEDTTHLVYSAAMAYPSSGVLYVSNGACGLTYDVENVTYTGNTGCGTVYVHGVDGAPLTIGAENDIVVDGNITYATGVAGAAPILGLIANNFVRIYHPVGSQPLTNNPKDCTNYGNVTTSISAGITVDAMMLSLQHSIIVDQYNCGSPMGSLTVSGGLAQEYRGAVGTETGSGTVVSGYAKNYNYDDRLRYEEPPHFINPVQGAWRVQSEAECYVTASNTTC